MKKILALICVQLLAIAKSALIGFIESKINKAVKKHNISDEVAEALKTQASNELEETFGKVENLRKQIQQETSTKK